MLFLDLFSNDNSGINKTPIFEGINNKTLIVSQDHREGINLPEGYILSANSEHYPNEAMQDESKKNLWGTISS